MQRTDGYRTETSVAGHDPAGAVAWLARQDGWYRRLRALEGDPRVPALSLRRTAGSPVPAPPVTAR